MQQDRAQMIRHLDEAQQEHFKEGLRRSEREGVRQIGEAWAAGQAPARTPKLVKVERAHGATETFVLSAKISRGKYGRFRRTLCDDGVLLGIKDFRLEGRFNRDMQRRTARIAALVQEGVITPTAARQLGFNEAKLVELVRTKTLSLMDVANVAKDRQIVAQWVAQGRLSADDGTELVFDRSYFEHLKATRSIDPEIAAKIATTHFSAQASIDSEYNILRQSGSPLAEMDRFAISDRLFVLTRAMDIDALTLAKLPMSDAQRASVTRHVLAHLARGLARFHDAGIVHRDVKLENALIDASGATEPADVGLAARLDADGLTTQAVGTLQYAAPEMVAYQVDLGLPSCPHGQPYTQAVDVFSLGVAAASLAACRNLILGEGAEALAALKDFVAIRESCPKDSLTGMCDLPTLLSDRYTLPVHSAAAEHARHVLRDWHTHDQATASYVFTHMLSVHPQQRASMKDIDARFGKAASQAKADACTTADLVKAHAESGVDDERAVMQAFSAALSAC